MTNWRDRFDLQLVTFQWLQFIVTVFPSVLRQYFLRATVFLGVGGLKRVSLQD